jgi:flavin reductase (DIM6/NTAB) family NADH-FMN oxidoreductase RutF
MIIDTTNIEKEELYKLLIGSVLPRPIAWVGTIDKDGKPNLAPFSFFNVASIAPPVISISILNKTNGIKKDSLANIQSTKAFSVSIVSRTLAEKMAITGVDYEPEINEFEIAEVSCVPCSRITSVRVGEAKVSLECRLHSITSFGDDEKAGNLILANIVAMHVDDDILKWPSIDMVDLDAIGRLSGPYYSTIKDRFSLE